MMLTLHSVTCLLIVSICMFKWLRWSRLARRKVPDARKLVYSRLDWDVTAPHDWWLDGPGFIVGIEALGELADVESQLQVVAFWRKERDMFTTSSAERPCSNWQAEARLLPKPEKHCSNCSCRRIKRSSRKYGH